MTFIPRILASASNAPKQSHIRKGASCQALQLEAVQPRASHSAQFSAMC